MNDGGKIPQRTPWRHTGSLPGKTHIFTKFSNFKELINHLGNNSSNHSKSQIQSPEDSLHFNGSSTLFQGRREQFVRLFPGWQTKMDRGFCSLLPVLHPRSQLSTHAGDNRYTPTSWRCLLRERSRETSGKGGGYRAPFSGALEAQAQRPFPTRACGSRDRTSR